VNGSFGLPIRGKRRRTQNGWRVGVRDTPRRSPERTGDRTAAGT
jgi:hypothetical protein